jgi:hypothetical protein
MKPLIKVTLLNNSSIAVFTQHIASIENSPRGCIIHMVNWTGPLNLNYLQKRYWTLLAMMLYPQPAFKTNK